MKFYRVSQGGDFEIKVIIARSEFEAVGYYMMELLCGGCLDDIYCVELPAEHPVEVSCVGFPVYQTLEEMVNDKKFYDTPSVLCGISE
jgi:hypothetical protein